MAGKGSKATFLDQLIQDNFRVMSKGFITKFEYKLNVFTTKIVIQQLSERRSERSALY